MEWGGAMSERPKCGSPTEKREWLWETSGITVECEIVRCPKCKDEWMTGTESDRVDAEIQRRSMTSDSEGGK